METKEFKAESKRLLEMMINSIYTHKEIFLRELISNASDAMDKLYFKSLTDTSVGMKREEFRILITPDSKARTLTIADNGIGMTAEELEANLGTIAKSGSLSFKKDNELGEDVNIIGQFGVGFYSAFMVASAVTVTSKAYGANKAYRWASSGTDGYTMEECEKETAGTEIVLQLKENADEEDYDKYTQEYELKNLVKKYSDYIRYPIQMEMDKYEYDEEKKESVPHRELTTLNSMVPIWKKNKSELKAEDYQTFYKDTYYDYETPLAYIHAKNEGTATYNALLFIPAKAPFDYYSKEFEKGLTLYSSGVMIMEKCADLLPDYFSFVRGLVDSEDLSLNISREMLQHDRQLKIIAKNIEKSIKNELTKMRDNRREDYEKFFQAFGLQLKFGVYQSYGMNKDALKDLLMFTSSFENKLVTLAEYVSRMKEDQKFIYYASGDSVARLEMLPQTEMVREKGYEILYLTDNVDEFAIKMLMEYDSKQFKSVTAGDLDLGTEEEKEEIKKTAEDSKDMFAFMKETLGDKITEVRVSSRLKTHPVCITSEGEISVEMEKILNEMPQTGANGEKVEAKKVLELNAAHPVFEKLKTLYASDKDKLAAYTKLLYSQALLIEGVNLENPSEFSSLMADLMANA